MCNPGKVRFCFGISARNIAVNYRSKIIPVRSSNFHRYLLSLGSCGSMLLCVDVYHH